MAGATGSGKDVTTLEELIVKRLRPALAYARANDGFLVMARTDALATLGYAEAIARARAFSSEGAHFVFVEAPEGERQLADVARDLRDVPSLVAANVVEGSRMTPTKSPRELHELGFDVGLYPVGPTLAGHAARDLYYSRLLDPGADADQRNARESGFDAFSTVLGKEQFERWNRYFSFG
jgi:2-methylisocitrate lyase-like PEP mutase family enzyme